MPCVYLAGNQEFYKVAINERLREGRRAAQGFANFHFLEQDVVTIGSVCFLSATLWTEYRIEGHQHLAMMHARDRMNDYRAIAMQKKPWMGFVPEGPAGIHEQSRVFLA
ncbi:MAG: hypothetical protein ACT6RB_15345 [Neoaquamicrobium sediminum]